MTMLDLGACFCGQPATRTLGTVVYCAGCLETVLAPLKAKHPASGGHGIQTGRLRPDYGDDWAELTCTNCGADWVGQVGDACSWCVKALDEPRRLHLATRPIANYETNGHQADDEPDPDADLREMLIDWPAFWAHDHADGEWLAEPLLPAERSVALFAPGGTGKSLLALWVSAHLAAGRDPFTGRSRAPVDVLYLDYEMTEADLSERLEQMGFGPDHDLTHLHYALLPSLPGLDQPDGGRAVVQLANLCRAQLCVIDTFGRAVHGDENDADTVRAWYRWTGIHLKHDGRAFLRVDHAGKDLTKGQRGTSAKNDDVDVVWQMTARDGGVFVLDAKKRRMGWVPLKVDIRMVEEPTLTFELVAGETWPAGTKEAAEALDELEVAPEVSSRKAAAALREAGQRARNEVIRAAQKYRRARSDTFHFVGDKTTQTGDNKCAPMVGARPDANGRGAAPGAPGDNDLFDQVDGSGRDAGRGGAQSPPLMGRVAPLLERRTRPTEPESTVRNPFMEDE